MSSQHERCFVERIDNVHISPIREQGSHCLDVPFAWIVSYKSYFTNAGTIKPNFATSASGDGIMQSSQSIIVLLVDVDVFVGELQKQKEYLQIASFIKTTFIDQSVQFRDVYKSELTQENLRRFL